MLYSQPVFDLTEKSIEIVLPNGKLATAFEVATSGLSDQSMILTKNQSILIKLPTEFGPIVLNLNPEEIVIDGFQVTEKNSSGETTNKTISIGKFFIGSVEDNPSSYVSLNINNSKISGIVRTQKRVFNIAYDSKSHKQLIYEHYDITDVKTFACDQIESESKNHPKAELLKTTNTCDNAVSIYFECDYHMYLNLNSNTQEVVNYVTTVFNEVHSIYATENIPILISQITVWTSDDPYTDSKSGIYDFADSLIINSFPGDIAQLLTNDPGANGGTAYVDQLCGMLPFSYCDIVNSNQTYPTYSWDVQVVAHELGHTFGSQHTHDCVWGANGDSQIDDCGNVATGAGGICYDASNPIIPAEGGTIMSYCHANPVGIDFLNGFGNEPGDLIRLNHQTCFCDNSQCNSALLLSINGSYYAHPSDGNGASTNNASHADWFKFEPSNDGLLTLASCGEGVDTRVWLWEGECGALNFVTISDDDCDSGNGSNYSSELIDFPVEAGKTYYIEWDNRWSNNEFNWDFEIQLSSTITCDSTYITSTGIISDSMQLHAQMDLEATSHIINNSQTLFKAGQSIDLLPGFELSLGSTLELSIENCEN